MRAIPLVHRTLRVPLLVVGLSLLSVASLPAQNGERFTLEGDDVALYNLAGEVEVEPGTGAVTLQLTRGGTDGRQAQGGAG
ncbi:MAG: hypothetical protein ACRDV9_10750 [Acidimicrobiia bacterium]